MWRMQLRQMRLQRGAFWGNVLFFRCLFPLAGKATITQLSLAWLKLVGSTFRKAIEKEEYQPEHDDREEATA